MAWGVYDYPDPPMWWQEEPYDDPDSWEAFWDRCDQEDEDEEELEDELYELRS